MSRDHNNLRVFHDSHALTVETYRQTKSFPREEWFGLRSQMRRAAVSVASNIVEGSARGSIRDYVRFLHMALGSACELKYLIALADELDMAPGQDWGALRQRCDRVVRQLNRLVLGLTLSGQSNLKPDA
jgi:four helix bundle protein